MNNYYHQKIATKTIFALKEYFGGKENKIQEATDDEDNEGTDIWVINDQIGLRTSIDVKNMGYEYHGDVLVEYRHCWLNGCEKKIG